MNKLLTALCLAMVLAFVATPASATIIDVNYYWYNNDGTYTTKADGDESWIYGDITGKTHLIKVEEIWKAGDQREGAALYPGVGMFKYDIHTTNYSGLIYDFKVYNPYHITAVATTPPEVNDGLGNLVTWNEAHANDYWYWSTTTAPMNGYTGYAYIYTNASRGYTIGEASDYIIYTNASSGDTIGEASDYIHTTFASGIVSGPVPEPTSMLLLGIGLIGLAGGKARKRFMA